MSANVIDFSTSLIYGDMGAAELGRAAPPLPPGALNHLRWTLDKNPVRLEPPSQALNS